VRRIGLGQMGFHSALLKMGIKYSSREALEVADELGNFIKNTAYDTSIMLAQEKGPFPAFKPEFCDSGFMKTMKPAIRRKVKEYGIRNCALLTLAPTGTTGMVSGVTTSYEPLMAPVYWRRIIKDVAQNGNNNRKQILVIEPEYEQYPDIVEGAADISVEQHFEIAATAQKHIDNAVSKTINMPKDYPVSKLSEVWLKYLLVLKGTTFYRWGSRENEPFTPVPIDEAQSVIDCTPEDQISRKERAEQQCVNGACEVIPFKEET